MQSNTQANSLLMTLVVAVVIGAAAFFGGMQYQKSRPFVPGMMGQYGNGQGFGGGQRTPGGTNRLGGNRPTNGVILSSDGKSITVKLADGSSKIVLLTSTTTINKADSATVADLKTGTMVAVFGQTNADGSVNAQSIQLNPVARPGMMGVQASPSTAPAGI